MIGWFNLWVDLCIQGGREVMKCEASRAISIYNQYFSVFFSILNTVQCNEIPCNEVMKRGASRAIRNDCPTTWRIFTVHPQRMTDTYKYCFSNSGTTRLLLGYEVMLQVWPLNNTIWKSLFWKSFVVFKSLKILLVKNKTTERYVWDSHLLLLNTKEKLNMTLCMGSA